MLGRLLKRLFGRSPAGPGGWRPYEPVSELTDLQIRQALTQDGLSHGRPADIDFVRRAIGGNQFAQGLDLRRHGTPAPAEKLRELGVRTNAILSLEYLETLTAKGLSDPIGAAQFITSACHEQLAGVNRRERYAHAGVSHVQVIPNSMAAGPCPACLALAEKPIPAEDAPDGPLPGCPHPSQCRLFTRAVMDFE